MIRVLFVTMLTGAMLLTSACTDSDDNEPVDADVSSPTTDTANSTLENQDVYRELSLSEAMEIAPFELLVPERVPDDLELAGIDVFLASDTSPFDAVYLVYRPADGETLTDPIVFQQTDMVSTLQHDDSEQVEIAGRTITTFHTASDADGNPLAMYAWSEENISYLLSGRLDGVVTEEHLFELVEALP